MKPSFGARPEFQPIDGFPVTDRRKVRAVLTEIDDTLTESGRLPAVAYQALENLHEAGLFVIICVDPCTGNINRCDQWGSDQLCSGAIFCTHARNTCYSSDRCTCGEWC